MDGWTNGWRGFNEYVGQFIHSILKALSSNIPVLRGRGKRDWVGNSSMDILRVLDIDA